MNRVGYLRVDIKRAFDSGRFVLAIGMSLCVLGFATLEGIALDTEVLYVFSLVMYGMPCMMLLLCGNVVYADSFCEDMEKKYIVQMMLRGDIKKYVTARCIAIFCSAAVAMMLGIVLYVCLLRLRLPWVVEGSMQYEYMMENGGLHFFLMKKWYVAYYLAYGLFYGIMAGSFALWSAYLSLYISNRMLVLTAPIILYYFADYLLAELFSGSITIARIFLPALRLWENEVWEWIFVAVIAILNAIVVNNLMQRRLRRKVYA